MQPPPVSIRTHPIKGSELFTEESSVSWCANGKYLKDRPVFTLDPAFHSGAYYVQEASSMFLGKMMEVAIGGRKNLRVLDLCAAPGGKSTLIASMLDSESLLISNEVIRSRASILEENMSRWGYANTWVTSNDPRDFGRLHGYFDIVVVDAPCSGSGLWRKDSASLGEWSEENVRLCSARQQRILADVWPAIKEGGTIIYSTCSFSQEEDEDILEWVAEEFGAGKVEVAIEQDWNIVPTIAPRTGMVGYRFFPDKLRGEGFFIAAMTKQTKADSIKVRKFRSAGNKDALRAGGHLLNVDDIVFTPVSDKAFHAVYSWHEQDIEVLKSHVYLRKAGLEAGMPLKGDWLPAHDIAMSVNLGDAVNTVDVDKNEALRFLKREDMGIDTARGWHVVRYRGWGLGWVKGLGNRVNNYLPKHWRIRMDVDFE